MTTTQRAQPMRAARWLLDNGPVIALAGIAGAGSFTHIRDTAHDFGQTGWLSWAVAVCIDLTCVMAARERHRDARTHRTRRGLVSWPTLVLTVGVLLSLAANLQQATPTPWGLVVAGTPAACFLLAVSMLERRAAHTTRTKHPDPTREPATRPGTDPAAAVTPRPDPEVIPSTGAARPASGNGSGPPTTPTRPASGRPSGAPTRRATSTRPTGNGTRPRQGDPGELDEQLVQRALAADAAHLADHGRRIGAERLRATLGIRSARARALRDHIHTLPAPTDPAD